MKEKNKKLEEEIWSAIGAFEQILEAIPNDRSSLDALAHAYEQIGDHTRARDYHLRFAQTVLDEKDSAGAKQALSKLEKYKEDDPEVAGVLSQLAQLVADEAPAAPPPPPSAKGQPDQVKSSASSGFSMPDALSFAWNLAEAGQITQEEYASVVQDLTDLSASAATTTVSVLHVLENNHSGKIGKILAHVAEESRMPYLALSCFNIRKKPLSLLPLDFMIRHGVLAFELLGEDGLVATVNPDNKNLRKDVERLTGRTCHFYVTLPSLFDEVMARAPEILEGEGEEED